MSGAKGKSGGARKGAGRKPAPSKPRYIRPVVLAPSNLLEQRATQWYLSLDPKTRLESIVEDFSFQPQWGEYLREIENLDGGEDEMIAKRIPGENEPTAGPAADIAPLFGLSLEEFNAARRAFVESEGFDGDGNEYENLYEWLTIPHNTRKDRTPFHKGDDHID